jgi:hypothetical protein
MKTRPSADPDPKPIRERFPPPWHKVPGGYRVNHREGTALAYVYAVDVARVPLSPRPLRRPTPSPRQSFELPELMPAP